MKIIIGMIISIIILTVIFVKIDFKKSIKVKQVFLLLSILFIVTWMCVQFFNSNEYEVSYQHATTAIYHDIDLSKPNTIYWEIPNKQLNNYSGETWLFLEGVWDKNIKSTDAKNADIQLQIRAYANDKYENKDVFNRIINSPINKEKIYTIDQHLFNDIELSIMLEKIWLVSYETTVIEVSVISPNIKLHGFSSKLKLMAEYDPLIIEWIWSIRVIKYGTFILAVSLLMVLGITSGKN